MDVVRLRYDDEFSKPITLYFGPVWGILLIGSTYMLVKGDIKYFFITMFFKVSLSFLIFLYIGKSPAFLVIILILLLLTNVLFTFNYSKMIIKDYLTKGYIPCDEESTRKLLEKRLYVKVI